MAIRQKSCATTVVVYTETTRCEHCFARAAYSDVDMKAPSFFAGKKLDELEKCEIDA